MHPIVRLAKEAVECFVSRGETTLTPDDFPSNLEEPCAAFVCLKKNGELRGCIGTVSPTCKTLSEEVIQNAISSCSRDPRFPVVDQSELADLEYSVDVLEPAEPVTDVSQLDPKTYGVIVTLGYRRGLLLPDLDGVDTVEQQLAIARRKAGIAPEETDISISRFRVKRYT